MVLCQNTLIMKSYKHIFIFNPKSSLLKIQSLGLKINSLETIDLKSKFPRYSDSDWDNVLSGGEVGSLILSGDLILSYSNNKFQPEVDNSELKPKPFLRRGMAAPSKKIKSSDFIEKLQAEFTSEQLLTIPESQVEKNTSALINKIDFEGFEDPLEE